MHKLVLILSICSALYGHAQQVLTPENMWKLKSVHSESVSPDGKTILYAVSAYDLEGNSRSTSWYLSDVNGANKRQINLGETTVSDAKWRPDGKKIGFLAQGNGHTQLWEMNVDGSSLRQVTQLPYDLSNWNYAPDLKHISFTTEVKMESSLQDLHPDLPAASGRAYDQLMFRHWTQWHDYSYSHLFYATYSENGTTDQATDIMKNEAFDCPLAPFGGAEQITWSPDGRYLVYVSKKLLGKEWATSTNSEIYRFDLESGKTENLSAGNEGYDNEPVFSPDGSKLAWLSMPRNGFESDKNIIRVLDLKTRKQKALTADLDQTFGHPVWSADGTKIYSLSPINATYQIFEIGINKSLDRASIRQVTQGEHNINSLHLAGNQLMGSKCSMSMPSALFTFSIKDGKGTQLTFDNQEQLESLKMGKVEQRMITTTDEKEMLTWIVYPPDFDPNKKYPTLLYCQGGPQSAVSQFWSTRWNFQLMAANGYIVVAPNRRGLPSFGQEWNDQISKDWGGQAMQDYLSAIDHMAKEPFVDTSKLGAVGASYGGYSVYYLAGIHEGRFSAFISHCGLYNLESWYGSTEELFFANWDVGGAYWDTPMPKSYEQFSPHRFVQHWDTPILVIHNELDFRVPLNQGLEAFTAAQLQNVPSKLLYFPNEGHWVLNPQNNIMWHREFYKWLDQWLKP